MSSGRKRKRYSTRLLSDTSTMKHHPKNRTLRPSWSSSTLWKSVRTTRSIRTPLTVCLMSLKKKTRTTSLYANIKNIALRRAKQLSRYSCPAVLVSLPSILRSFVKSQCMTNWSLIPSETKSSSIRRTKRIRGTTRRLCSSLWVIPIRPLIFSFQWFTRSFSTCSVRKQTTFTAADCLSMSDALSTRRRTSVRYRTLKSS